MEEVNLVNPLPEVVEGSLQLSREKDNGSKLAKKSNRILVDRRRTEVRVRVVGFKFSKKDNPNTNESASQSGQKINSKQQRGVITQQRH